MVAPLPPARAVAPRPWRDYALLALLVLLGIGVPIAFRLLVPPDTTWVGWGFHAAPVVVAGIAIVELRRRRESPWALVCDRARRCDPRRWIYAGFDIVFAAGYLYAFEHLIPNRHGWATLVLEILPLATWLMALGTLAARGWSRWLVIAGGVVMLAWTVAIFFLLLYTASYLAGVYGAFGKASSSGILLAMALVVELVALLPALQLKWTMTRAGRRAFGIAA
jgi:hypothetical protein